ncbi:MAG: glycine cleavage system regulatory protein [Alteromonadaceae bacterium]|jgi:glycine cleavage system regulatory protein
MKHIVLSFISPDRPGLVDTLSNIINQHQGNWQASSLHHMSGFFTGVIEVAAPESQCQALIEKLESIEGLSTVIKVAEQKKSVQSPSIVLDLTANDRVGIVQEISSVIHHQGGNLLKLVSKQESAAHSAVELFKAKVTVSVDAKHIEDLIQGIENLADDLVVDIAR